jgi:hypothetical protein
MESDHSFSISLEHSSGAGVAGLDSQLYAIGGYDGTQHLNSTECYSACADRWMTLKGMNCKRCYVGKCFLLLTGWRFWFLVSAIFYSPSQQCLPPHIFFWSLHSTLSLSSPSSLLITCPHHLNLAVVYLIVSLSFWKFHSVSDRCFFAPQQEAIQYSVNVA